MKLKSFRVYNFRSINDSGLIDVSNVTAILGRNESGKSNLLLALRSLSPVEGFTELNKIKNFPRHRRLEECTDSTKVVETIWELSGKDKAELAAIWPRASKSTAVTITRCYGKMRTVGFDIVQDQEYDEAAIKKGIRKIVPAARAAAGRLEGEPKAQLEKAADAFERAITPQTNPVTWATPAVRALAALRQAYATAGVDISDTQDNIIADLESTAGTLAGDEDAGAKARNWAVGKLPIFIYLDEYPELSGHQNVADLMQRREQGNLTNADRNFEKMCKVAGLNPEELQKLLQSGEAETRNQLVNRASAVITGEIRRLWKDRPLKVRFNVDAQYLDTFVSDPNATYDIEVNLDEISRGFRWFFSFYITFSADTNGGAATNAILLLDEPGLYLHARSQTDLLAHLDKDFTNQIIYTTHSPFMVPVHRLDAVRTVSIAEDAGTTVTNDPTGDARTLFPLQAALGYDLAQSLFVGPNNLVVEGVTDYWILSSISGYLSETGGQGLRPELTITPAGGAQKVSYMVALLTSEQLNVLVLLDDEKEARTTKDELIKSKLIRDQNVVFVTEAHTASAPKEADIEDLLDSDVYEKLVRDSYAKELKGKALTPNPKIPRIAKRIEAVFEDLGIEFHKTRPSRLLLNMMGSDPASIVTPAAAQRFERLFTVINERRQKHIDRVGEPFR